LAQPMLVLSRNSPESCASIRKGNSNCTTAENFGNGLVLSLDATLAHLERALGILALCLVMRACSSPPCSWIRGSSWIEDSVASAGVSTGNRHGLAVADAQQGHLQGRAVGARGDAHRQTQARRAQWARRRPTTPPLMLAKLAPHQRTARSVLQFTEQSGPRSRL
jgi:hypothetical protein